MNYYEDGFDLIGGGSLSDEDIPIKICEPDLKNIKSETDRELALLAKIHPELNLKFKNNDLASLSEADKEEILNNIYELYEVA